MVHPRRLPVAPQNSPPPATALPDGRRCRCSEFGSYGRAQELLRQGHTNLDSNGNGEACESLSH